MNTGYTKEDAEKSIKRIDGLNGGIEHGTLENRTYRSEWIKNPNWINIKEFESLRLHHKISRVIIPVRNSESVANSREYMANNTHGNYGGFAWGAKDKQSQKIINAMLLCEFIEYLASSSMKFEIVSFKEMMKNCKYLYKILKPDITFERFAHEYDLLLDPEKIRF